MRTTQQEDQQSQVAASARQQKSRSRGNENGSVDQPQVKGVISSVILTDGPQRAPKQARSDSLGVSIPEGASLLGIGKDLAYLQSQPGGELHGLTYSIGGRRLFSRAKLEAFARGEVIS